MTTDPWPLRSSLVLGALSSAVPCACLHVRHVLAEIVTDLDILRRLRDHLSSPDR